MSDDDLVWYVAYGSNIDRTRLLTYVEGDRHLGPSSTHDGARDRRPPLADAPHELAFDVFFALQRYFVRGMLAGAVKG